MADSTTDWNELEVILKQIEQFPDEYTPKLDSLLQDKFGFVKTDNLLWRFDPKSNKIECLFYDGLANEKGTYLLTLENNSDLRQKTSSAITGMYKNSGNISSGGALGLLSGIAAGLLSYYVADLSLQISAGLGIAGFVAYSAFEFMHNTATRYVYNQDKKDIFENREIKIKKSDKPFDREILGYAMGIPKAAEAK